LRTKRLSRRFCLFLIMMFPRSIRLSWFVLAVTTFLFAIQQAEAGRILSGHVPTATRTLASIGDMPTQGRLQLAIGLPVRDQAGLDAFLRDVSDPASPNFRHYLTPSQFTEMFGPTEQDCQAVIDFAEAHGLAVTNVHPNRLVVDVTGSVADVQRTFHIVMRNFRHPTEARTFFAPDVEPSIDQAVPILHIGGLSNYWLPHPQSRIRPLGIPSNNATPNDGSGPAGTFLGSDFRAAYLPGISLTGAGQAVGLLEFDGYNPNDIAIYLRNSGLNSVPLQNVFVDGYSGRAGSGNGEVCLDIEVAIAMAPGLSKVIVYEAPNASPWDDILSQMANDNLAKQLSCSWGGGPPDSTAEQIFQQMAAQGQTFFNATGDDDAYTNQVPFPTDSPNITQVGGTTLFTVSPGGAWSSETTWNWGPQGGSYVGSSGGISPFYSIPSWQQGTSMSTNQGSTTFRNFPDVALTADNVYTVSDNGRAGSTGGTSCAAPLWAGFTALVNQQAANNGQPPVGFINPALYVIGHAGNYASIFHDITTGNNITNQSNGKFSAVAGYDLCTGWGTPNSGLISALVSPGSSVTTYNVDTSANPTNGGTVAGAGAYVSGAQVTVTATPNAGFIFSNWTENGSVISTSSSYSFPANANRTLVANFTVSNTFYTVTVQASPANGGTVFGSGSFSTGTQTTVSAFPKRKFAFLNWSVNGVVVSTSASYSFTVDSNQNLVAQFVRGRGRPRRR
jgi:subtilase family serine protease